MKDSNKNILNNQDTNSSNLDEYSFTVSQGKSSANVIIKLDIAPDEKVTNEDIAKGLVKYINAFEDILSWQSND